MPRDWTHWRRPLKWFMAASVLMVLLTGVTIWQGRQYNAAKRQARLADQAYGASQWQLFNVTSRIDSAIRGRPMRSELDAAIGGLTCSTTLDQNSNQGIPQQRVTYRHLNGGGELVVIFEGEKFVDWHQVYRVPSVVPVPAVLWAGEQLKSYKIAGVLWGITVLFRFAARSPQQYAFHSLLVLAAVLLYAVAVAAHTAYDNAFKPEYGTWFSMSVVSLFVLIRALLKRPEPIVGVCSNCGYDLRATPDRCPECGTVPAL